MKKVLKLKFILCIFVVALSAAAQTDDRSGTLKVQKSDLKYKAVYDDVYQRLLMKDGYGNIYDTAVYEFKMTLPVNGVMVGYYATSNTLTTQMKNVMRKTTTNTIIVFDEIKAKDRFGNRINLPIVKHSMGRLEENQE
jgi:hypothetical protein